MSFLLFPLAIIDKECSKTSPSLFDGAPSINEENLMLGIKLCFFTDGMLQLNNHWAEVGSSMVEVASKGQKCTLPMIAMAAGEVTPIL